MGGAKQMPPRSFSNRSQPKKKQHVNPNVRTKLKKELGLPDLGKFTPAKTMGARKEQSEKNDQEVSGPGELAALMLNAARAQAEYSTRQQLAADMDQRTATKDSSCRAYYKEFRKVVESADVLLEVLDARDPSGCRCLDIEQSIQSEFPEKQIVLVLNKIDLVPQEIAEKWLGLLRSERTVVLFTATKRKWIPQCVGNLFRVLKQFGKSESGGKKFMTIGVIGYPNVGKSSIINALKRENVVAVADSPGFTKVASEVSLNKHFKIMDCPGIVFSSAMPEDVVLRNAIKVDTLEDPVRPVELILQRCDKQILLDLYRIQDFADVLDFLAQVAKRRNKVGKRGEALIDDTARSVLKDWNASRIPFYTVPPEEDEDPHTVRTIPEQDELEVQILRGLTRIKDIRAKGEVVFRTAELRKQRAAGPKRKRDEDEDDEEFDDEEPEDHQEEDDDGFDED
eukprot:TRINITY_DN41195_c0_g1_i1.p1 TRINITY_DN41195_c0_g1~~TRINITY_DN41195_c0_g1_i1.p1  ORF type:complete len:465 (+),score=106.10 TRINITY_DN41195_c0_g1_i1:39-1397(+)